jgi:serine/threonine-protein kinase
MTQERIYSPGESIGPYKVARVIATGGMAIIYEATPDPTLRGDLLAMGVRRLAVKVARLEVLPDDRHARKRLVECIDREFDTLIELTRKAHPNVVRVYDRGREDGVPYYAMEVVEGVTLTQALEGQPRLGQILHVFGKLCGAVAFLHQGDICHRDLKPSNVLLRLESGEPVLIDFGICLPPSERTLTGPHELLGTPTYLSPEYAAHWLKPEQTRPYLAAPTDDVWALGIMLYEILTGATPWRTPSTRPEALLREIQASTPPHPTDVYPRIPRAIGDLTMKLLEKNHHKRPRNAVEVLGLLGKAAEGTDVLSPIPPRRNPYRRPPKKGGKPTRPRRGPGSRRGQIQDALAIALLVAMVIFVVGFLLGHGSGESALASDRSGYPMETETSTDPGKTVPAPAQPPLWEPPNFDEPLPPENGEGPESVTKGKPLPRKPYRGQLRAPCPRPYKEMIGACWKEFRPIYKDDSPAPCPEESYEVQGRCFMIVMDDAIPNATKTEELDGGTP